MTAIQFHVPPLEAVSGNLEATRAVEAMVAFEFPKDLTYPLDLPTQVRISVGDDHGHTRNTLEEQSATAISAGGGLNGLALSPVERHIDVQRFYVKMYSDR